MSDIRSSSHITTLSIAQFSTNENPGINIENDLSSEQSKRDFQKPSTLSAEYVNIKNFYLTRELR